MDIEHRQLVQLLPILPLLAELGRTQHITETAELLGVPQSTVSRALARASAVVGTDLLVRDGRGVRLTPAARRLLPYVESALAEFRAGLDLVRHESEVVRGRITVTFQHTFGEATLPLLISAFRSRHPQTAFDLSQGVPRQLPGGAFLRGRRPGPDRTRGAAQPDDRVRRAVQGTAASRGAPPAPAGRPEARLWPTSAKEPFVALGSGYGCAP